MSPASVSNFVGDLVAMATAFERLPQVEADLADARNTINAHLNTIQRLEHKLLDRANDLTDAQSRIRSLEVERDDAQFHALEADDRTQRALDFIKTTFGNAGSLIQALEPAPEPKTIEPASSVPVQAMPEAPAEAPMTMPVNEPESGQSEPLPSDATASTSASGAQPIDQASVPSSSAPEVAPMQAPLPDAPSMEVGSANTTSAETQAVPSLADASTPTSPSPTDASRRFVGKTWTQARSEGLNPPYDKDGWLDGGGTLDNYYA